MYFGPIQFNHIDPLELKKNFNEGALGGEVVKSGPLFLTY